MAQKAEVGNFPVNPRFHPTDVGWNLGSNTEISNLRKGHDSRWWDGTSTGQLTSLNDFFIPQNTAMSFSVIGRPVTFRMLAAAIFSPKRIKHFSFQWRNILMPKRFISDRKHVQEVKHDSIIIGCWDMHWNVHLMFQQQKVVCHNSEIIWYARCFRAKVNAARYGSYSLFIQRKPRSP